MAYTKLGRIRPVYKGTWSASAAYTALEMVKSADGGTAYIAVKDVPAGTALTNAAYWGVVLDVSDVLAAADEAIAAAVARADEAAASANTAAALAPKPLELTESAQPAQVWPEEGSPLRPVISMLPAQTGSGDPSPENVRPISGRTAVTVTRCGKNLFDKDNYDASDLFVPSRVGGYFGKATPARSVIIRIAPNAAYTVSKSTSTIMRIGTAADYPTLDGAISKYAEHSAASDAPLTITSGESDHWMLIQLFVDGDVGTEYGSIDAHTESLMVECGSSQTAYEPYRGNVFSIELGRTVYGGTLDANSGVLTVDRALTTYDGTESDWKAGDNNFFITLSAIDQNLRGMVSNQYVDVKNTVNTYQLTANQMRQGAVATNICFGNPSNALTLDEWKTHLAQNPIQLCYYLAESVTVQLDPAVIPALEGLNTVTSTGESMTLTYNKSLVREHGEIMARLTALEAAALGNT